MPAAAPHILLVDDSEETTDVMAMALEQEGLSSAIVHSGQQALDYLVANPKPACMLIDFDMPDMDGLELVERIRAYHGDDIVLIAVSGSFDLKTDRLQAMCDAVDHHFWKPVKWHKQMEVLEPLR